MKKIIVAVLMTLTLLLSHASPYVYSANNTILIRWDRPTIEPIHFFVYTISGQLCKKGVFPFSSTTAVHDLSSGVYIVKITSGNTVDTFQVKIN
jgi:hypothetical protein